MTEDRFLDCLDLWGSDLSRWPAADQEAARMLLTRSALARDALARDRMMDVFLEAGDPATAENAASLSRVKQGVFVVLAAEAASRFPTAEAASRFPTAEAASRPSAARSSAVRVGMLADRIRGWFDLPGPMVPWGIRLASVVLIAALLGSLTARSITLTTPSGTALEQIAMATPYTSLDVQ